MSFLGSIAMVAAAVGAVRHFWEILLDGDTVLPPRSFRHWAIKGLAIPCAIWMFCNMGLMQTLPPLVPGIKWARLSGAGWLSSWSSGSAGGISLIATYWAAVSLAWMAVEIGFNAQNRSDFFGMAGFYSLLMLPVVGLGLFWTGLYGAGFLVSLWGLFVVRGAAELVPNRPKRPMYSKAIARMKFGRYGEAEEAVISELEKREDDFDGWMMLAELYAYHFHDLAEADKSIRSLCDQPNLTGAQISVALHKLADWHLKLAQNPIAAKRALELIGRKIPGSHFARMAGQRIRQLPSSREELQAQLNRKVKLPALKDPLDFGETESEKPEDRSAALAAANRCIEKLKKDPNQAAPREELAKIFADRLGIADQGIDQLKLLIEMPDQPSAKVAEWLGLIAAWELKYRRNRTRAKAVWEQLIHELPQTPQAFAAQRHLNMIELEEKLQGQKHRA